MYFQGNTIIELLKDKGIRRLFHANSATSAKTFLEQNSLLSREYAEKHSLSQTDQKSDKQDKLLGIYNKIFLDNVDIHGNFSLPNLYGPILFAFSPNILTNCSIQICKSNPIKWINSTKDLFQSIDEIHSYYSRDDLGQHIMVCTETLPFNDCLEEIFIDIPSNIDKAAYDYTLKMLQNANTAYSSIIKLRYCDDTKCKDRYRSNGYVNKYWK